MDKVLMELLDGGMIKILTFFLKKWSDSKSKAKFCGPAGGLAPWREHAPPRKDSKWLVETENPFSSRRVILYRNKSKANRASKWSVTIYWKISQKWAYLLILCMEFAKNCPELRKNVWLSNEIPSMPRKIQWKKLWPGQGIVLWSKIWHFFEKVIRFEE